MIRATMSRRAGFTCNALVIVIIGAASLATPVAAAQKAKKATVAKAATGPAELVKSGDWAAYSANSGKAKTCYALGRPKERLPASLKRDPGYVFISNRPGDGIRNEVSIVMGFDVKDNTEPKAEMGSSNFEMVAKGANLWVKNPAQEAQFIDALKRNQRLTVKATSKKGNATTDTYLLAGLQTALERSSKECQ